MERHKTTQSHADGTTMGRFPRLTPVRLSPQVPDHMTVSRRDVTKGKRTYEVLPSTGCGTISRQDVKGERQAHMRAVEKVPDWTWQGGTTRCDKGQAHR